MSVFMSAYFSDFDKVNVFGKSDDGFVIYSGVYGSDYFLTKDNYDYFFEDFGIFKGCFFRDKDKLFAVPSVYVFDKNFYVEYLRKKKYRTSADIYFTKEHLVIFDSFKVPIFENFNNGVFSFSKDFSYNDSIYKIDIRADFDNLDFYIYIAKYEGEEEHFVPFTFEFYEFYVYYKDIDLSIFKDEVKLYFDNDGKKLYVQVIEGGDLVYSGFISFDDFKPDYNFYSNYYLTYKSCYRLVDDVKLPVYIEFNYDIDFLISRFHSNTFSGDVTVSPKFISFHTFEVPVSFYEKDGYLEFVSDKIVYDDKHYKIYLKIDFNSLRSVFYIAEIVDNKEVFADVFLNLYDYFFFRNSVLRLIYFYRIFKDVDFIDKFNRLDDRILTSFDNFKDDLNSLKDFRDLLFDLNKKFSVFDVLDISKMIDDKLTQIFNLKSLNGSNGSKFKDGSIVKIKGYDGDWRVEGSYPMLNSDGVTIIVYKVVQDGRVLLAPSPFVGV